MDFGSDGNPVHLAGDIEITLHEAASGTLLFRAWFNTAMLPAISTAEDARGPREEQKKKAGDGDKVGTVVARGHRAERLLSLSKLELDKLHNDKKHKLVGADYGLTIKLQDCDPVLL